MHPAAELSATAGRVALALAGLGVLLAAADTYVVVLALPEIMLDVGLDAEQLQRAAPIVSAFLLGYVAALPLAGRLSDLHGRRPVLVGCLVLLAVGSLVTAAAPDLVAVVIGRFLQGAGGGGLVPATLALVADLWPPQRRGVPLGVVGAVQELGAVVGPLLGALVLELADWRAIFWLTLVLALALASGLRLGPGRSARPLDLLGMGVAVVGLAALGLALAAPAALSEDVTAGALYVPLAGGTPYATPLALATMAAAAVLLARGLTARHPLVDLRQAPGSARAADLPGAALLGVALGSVVLTFASSDPEVEVLSPAGPWLLLGGAAALAAFVVRQRRIDHPLVPAEAVRPRAAWGAHAVSVLVGAGLVVALVDVPVYARAVLEDESQLDAALVLLRLLAALPVGAVAGGWLLRRAGCAATAAGGLALATLALVLMSRWDAEALASSGSGLTLAAAGFGFGLAVAPVNAALLGATPSPVHGIASALVVVARTVGMIVGLSALSAYGVRRFHAEAALVAPPAQLCPDSPAACPAYVTALRDAALTQLQTTFGGAAACLAVATGLAAWLLRAPRTSQPHPPAAPPNRPE